MKTPSLSDLVSKASLFIVSINGVTYFSTKSLALITSLVTSKKFTKMVKNKKFEVTAETSTGIFVVTDKIIENNS